jgi:hypothetical protein
VEIAFAILIWHQAVIVQEKALAAKRRQQEYLDQLEIGELENNGGN